MNTKNLKKVTLRVPYGAHLNCVCDLVLPTPLKGGAPKKDEPVAHHALGAHKKLTITGPLGVQSMIIPNIIDVAIAPKGALQGSIIISTPSLSECAARQRGGLGGPRGEYIKLNASLIQQMIKGVTVGFQKQIKLIGIGYKVAPIGWGPEGANKNTGPFGALTFNIGFSHPVVIPMPPTGNIVISDVSLKENKTDPSSIILNSTSLIDLNNFVDSIHRIRPVAKSFKGTGISVNTPL